MTASNSRERARGGRRRKQNPRRARNPPKQMAHKLPTHSRTRDKRDQQRSHKQSRVRRRSQREGNRERRYLLHQSEMKLIRRANRYDAQRGYQEKRRSPRRMKSILSMRVQRAAQDVRMREQRITVLLRQNRRHCASERGEKQRSLCQTTIRPLLGGIRR